jgi:hypothetical protein
MKKIIILLSFITIPSVDSRSMERDQQTNVKEELITCSKCQVPFKNGHKHLCWQFHGIKQEQRGITNSECACGFDANVAQNITLELHCITHSVENGYKCEKKDCARVWPTIGKLIEHMAKHTKEKLRCSCLEINDGKDDCMKHFNRAKRRILPAPLKKTSNEEPVDQKLLPFAGKYILPKDNSIPVAGMYPEANARNSANDIPLFLQEPSNQVYNGRPEPIYDFINSAWETANFYPTVEGHDNSCNAPNRKKQKTADINKICPATLIELDASPAPNKKQKQL